MGKAQVRPESVVASSLPAAFRRQPAILGSLGAMCLATALALLFLGEKSLWLDEVISVAVARSDWPTIWYIITHGEASPGFYYILLHLWLELGESEFVVRGLSAVFAVLTVPVVYALGSRLFTKQVGLLAALLLAVNPFFIQYSQEARSYSLVLLLAGVSSLLFIKALRRPSKWLWAAYAVSSGLAIYAHIFAGFVLAAHAVSLLFIHRQDIPWKGLLLAWIAGAILVLPLAYSILTSSMGNLDWQLRPGILQLGYVFMSFAHNPLFLVLYFILCAAALIHAVRQWQVSRTSVETWRYSLLLLWLFLPIALAFCISQVKPMFTPYYLIVCIPPLFLLAAIGISCMPGRWIGIAGLVIVLALSGFGLYCWYVDYEKEDFRGATQYVCEMAEEGDAIIFYSIDARTGFDYYRSRAPASTRFPAEVLYFASDKYQSLNPVFNLPEGYVPGGRQPEPDEALTDRLSDYDRVWLVLCHDQIANLELGRDRQSALIRTLLEQRYDLADEREFEAIKVLLYDLPPGN